MQAGGTDSKETDQTKAIAIPILGIVAIMLAAYITRSQFSAAFSNCRSDIRLTILFFGSALCALLSVFLFPSAGWEYGVANCVLSYTMALMCNPGMIQMNLNKTFFATWGWFLLLVGMPDGWNGGIIESVTAAQCQDWFKMNNDAMCKGGWLTFLVLCALIIILVNLFSLLMVISYMFEGTDASSLSTALPIGGGGGMAGYSPVGEDSGAAGGASPGAYEPVGAYQAVGDDAQPA